jgi:phosphatidylglycerol---prolipoprotein diacylglyceryl transferase
LAIWRYGKKHHIPFWQLNDAAAPALMLSYAVGRIGCQVSGDGDWGIPNSAYIANPHGKTIPAGLDQFYLAIRQNPEYFTDVFGSLGRIRHASLQAPSFLPDWLFAYAYPHNVNDIGLRLFNCMGAHCAYLPVPVFPTSLYETILGTIIFFVLWSLRKRLRVPGTLFSIYLVLNGIERFFIEKIRVNSTYNLLGLRPTQAELISLSLVILGTVSFFLLRKKGETKL